MNCDAIQDEPQDVPKPGVLTFSPVDVKNAEEPDLEVTNLIGLCEEKN